MTIVYEAAGLRGPAGGALKLSLVLELAGSKTEIRIDREERLSHKTLSAVVLRVRDAGERLRPLARDTDDGRARAGAA